MILQPNIRKRLLKSFGILFLFALSTYNQPYYPLTWFDEGLALQGAWNLVENGQYAMRSMEGYRVLDQPLIANGPGLVLPISAVFHFFGIGLLQARLLLVVYFVGAIILFFRIVSRYFGEHAAYISTFFLIAVPAEGFVIYGRQVLGNIPALMYFIGGLLFFSALGQKKNIVFASATGLCFGFALVTKGQYWITIPVLTVVFVFDILYYKQFELKWWGIILCTAILPSFIWLGAQYSILGGENFENHLAALDSSAKVSVFAFRDIRILGNIWYLIRSGILIFSLPGLVLALHGSRRRTMRGLFCSLVLIFVVFWIIWYIVASVGWHRYAFEAFALGMIFTGSAYLRMKTYIRLTSQYRKNIFSSATQGSLVLLIIVAFLWSTHGFFSQITHVVLEADRSPQKFAEYLNKHIPKGSVIESWEWELDILTPDLEYHHPTNDWVDRETARIQFGEQYEAEYDIVSSRPDYLILGPFSKQTKIYSTFLENGCCSHITTVGEYSLFKINSTQNDPKGSEH
jgi:4-amino-4-deoxy-L-arabinose transferase-like glycosyltransferase